MLYFTEFPPTPGSVVATQDYFEFADRFGAEATGEAVGSMVLANVEGRNPVLAREVCDAFRVTFGDGTRELGAVSPAFLKGLRVGLGEERRTYS